MLRTGVCRCGLLRRARAGICLGFRRIGLEPGPSLRSASDLEPGPPSPGGRGGGGGGGRAGGAAGGSWLRCGLIGVWFGARLLKTPYGGGNGVGVWNSKRSIDQGWACAHTRLLVLLISARRFSANFPARNAVKKVVAGVVGRDVADVRTFRGECVPLCCRSGRGWGGVGANSGRREFQWAR